MTYLLIFVTALTWQVYCEHKGYTFYIGLTCFALGIVGAVALGRFEASHGLAQIMVGSTVGFLIG